MSIFFVHILLQMLQMHNQKEIREFTVLPFPIECCMCRNREGAKNSGGKTAGLVPAR